ncbi:MAG: hypothetical protein A3G93_13300 [Nitrospinae bacterium RIFCSPLOWO2_12_FULL_45_22]|nr:MAG: hypothetical protein A3G93_13300 [Nitrospinae bacterium RIFCSPLOWO2_12_FULL_45_22]
MARKIFFILLFALLVLIPQRGYVESSLPEIKIFTNGPSFRSGDTLSLAVSLRNPGAEMAVDVYLGFILPNGAIYFFDETLKNLVPGDIRDHATFTAVGNDVTLPSGFDLQLPGFFSLKLPIIPDGTYAVFAFLAEPGSAQSGSIQVIGGVSLVSFSYTSAQGAIEIINEYPIGTISNRRPTISATVRSSYNSEIDLSTIRMTLDGSLVSHNVSGAGSNVQLSYTPSYDLAEGEHRVSVNAKDVNGVAAKEKAWRFEISVANPECVNISGLWNWSETVTVTCTAEGESETETISGSGVININQKGCNVNWTASSFNVDRTGTIQGNNIQVSGQFVIPLEEDVNITQNIFTAKGNISGNQFNLNGSGIATGTYEDISFSCTGTSTAVFTRANTSSLSSEKEVIREPSLLFFNNAIKIVTTVAP